MGLAVNEFLQKAIPHFIIHSSRVADIVQVVEKLVFQRGQVKVGDIRFGEILLQKLRRKEAGEHTGGLAELFFSDQGREKQLFVQVTPVPQKIGRLKLAAGKTGDDGVYPAIGKDHGRAGFTVGALYVLLVFVDRAEGRADR